MKKFFLCKLCLIVFGALLLVACAPTVTKEHKVSNTFKNGKGASLGRNNRIPQKGSSPTVEQMRLAFRDYFDADYFRPYQGVAPSDQPRVLRFRRKDDEAVRRALESKGLVSYLRYEKGVITVDELSPLNKLGDLVNNDKPLNSQSVGKSLTAYLLGHAICQGFISSLDQSLSDWPLIRDTPYQNLTLTEVVNMSGGDSRYFKSSKVLFKNTDRQTSVNNRPISYWAKSLQGKTGLSLGFSSSRGFHYSGMLSNLTINYVRFKSGEKFETLLNDLYRDKAGIEHEVSLKKVDLHAEDNKGPFTSTIFATRYDYLRIAIAILEDWRNDTCVGQYLKELYDRRVINAYNPKGGHGLFRSRSHSKGTYYDYAGFFHTNPSGGKGTIFVMHGYGGQVIAINFDTETIVVANSVHEDWDTGRLIIDAVNQ